MFRNWSTKDEIETSIRTFQSVRDEIENTFSRIEWRDDENGRENLYLNLYHFGLDLNLLIFTLQSIEFENTYFDLLVTHHIIFSYDLF